MNLIDKVNIPVVLALLNAPGWVKWMEIPPGAEYATVHYRENGSYLTEYADMELFPALDGTHFRAGYLPKSEIIVISDVIFTSTEW